MAEKPLLPGSPEALKAGCTCPISDNAGGKGFMCISDVYWMSEGCPIHGKESGSDGSGEAAGS